MNATGSDLISKKNYLKKFKPKIHFISTQNPLNLQKKSSSPDSDVQGTEHKRKNKPLNLNIQGIAYEGINKSLNLNVQGTEYKGKNKLSNSRQVTDSIHFS